MEIKRLPDSEIEIAGEISAGDFEFFREKAIKKLSEEVKIDGFRPGNIPEKILINKIGEPAVLDEMAELALQKAYPKIIEENKIQAIGRPEITITKIARNNPLGFKIKTAVMPEIKLPDYKKIAEPIMKIKEEITVEAKEIEQSIEHLRKSRATKNDKNEEVLPELNDEFVKTLGEFENVETFKKTIHKNLLAEKKIKAREKKRLEILDKIIEAFNIEIPKVLIEGEKNKMLNETKANIEQMGLKWEDYLKRLKKNEEEILKDWDNDAAKRVKYGLVLNEISGKEKIEISEDELGRETDRLMERYKNSGQSLDPERAKNYIYGMLRNEKVFQFLELC